MRFRAPVKRTMAVAATALAAGSALPEGGARGSSLDQAGETTPCTQRYRAGAVLPPGAPDRPLLTTEGLKAVPGLKGWGLGETAFLRYAPGAARPLFLEVRLPRGSINPGNRTAPRGGVGLRWRPGVPREAEAACLAYDLFLPRDFAFNRGGKLPGLFGGSGPAGGRRADGRNGFSVRLMWRRGGAGEVYAYVPGHPEGRGLSIARGAFIFPRGRWVRIEEEVRLNRPGRADGRLRVWVDGRLRIERAAMVYRTRASLSIAGVMADVFYGGKSPAWAAPRDAALRLGPLDLRWR